MYVCYCKRFVDPKSANKEKRREDNYRLETKCNVAGNEASLLIETNKIQPQGCELF